jgi:hypothetical protein
MKKRDVIVPESTFVDAGEGRRVCPKCEKKTLEWCGSSWTTSPKGMVGKFVFNGITYRCNLCDALLDVSAEEMKEAESNDLVLS